MRVGHQILAPVELANVVHGENVRMIQGGRELRFTLKALPRRGAREVVREQLDRNRATELRVVGSIDVAHASGSEQRSDFVLTESCPDHAGSPESHADDILPRRPNARLTRQAARFASLVWRYFRSTITATSSGRSPDVCFGGSREARASTFIIEPST
jgi:hypothetical protein